MRPVRRFRGPEAQGEGEERSPATPVGPASPGGTDPEGAPTARSAALELAAKIEEILETAERSAEAIQQEAETTAQRYVAERRREADRESQERLRASVLDLEQRALAAARVGSTLRREAERVLEQVRSLELAAENAHIALRGQPAGEGPQEPRDAAVVPGPEPVRESAGTRWDVTEEVLLRAAHLAVRGSDRDEIEGALRTEFGIEAPGPIVDEILGG